MRKQNFPEISRNSTSRKTRKYLFTNYMAKYEHSNKLTTTKKHHGIIPVLKEDTFWIAGFSIQ